MANSRLAWRADHAREYGRVDLIVHCTCTLLAACLLSIVLPASTLGRTWLVRADGSGDVPTIQAGVDSSADADTVLVLPGVYHELLTISGKPQLVLRGYVAELTTIDAQFRGRALWLDGGVVSALTICHGSTPTQGAGVHAEARAPVFIQNCIIEDNRYIGYEVEGGGIYAYSAAAPVVIHSNRIRNNLADGGSAIAGLGAVSITNNIITSNEGLATIAATGSVAIEGNLIFGNAVGNLIVEVWATGLSATIRSNTIVDNTVAFGGSLLPTAIRVFGEGAVSIEQNIIAWNRSTWPGGGQQPAISCGSNTTLRCNVLWMNETDSVTSSCDTTGSHTRLIDPLFCDRGNGDYRLRLDSPCGPIPWSCPLIGAYPPVCPSTNVRSVAWSDVKRLFR